MRQLRDQQIHFAPREKKLQQLRNAEKLFYEIEAKKAYPYRTICERITDFRAEMYPDLKLDGKDLRHDLVLFIEDLSDSADIDAASIGEKIWTIEQLSERFNVSTKTISRWRKRGLLSRRFSFDGKKRVGFLDSSVERFIQKDPSRIRRGARFSQLTENEKETIIRRARRLANAGGNPTEIARRLARRTGRSVETIRYTLQSFDYENSDMPIFPNRSKPLNEETKRRIHQGFLRNESVESLARRFQRTKGSIYRIVGQMRTRRIMDLPLDYIDSPEFDMIRSGGDESKVVGPLPAPAKNKDKDGKPIKRRGRRPAIPADLPAYLAGLYEVPLLTRDQEIHLFRKMNYLKYKAAKLRDQLDPARPKAHLMSRIERLYDEAVETKNQIVSSNLRLVVSIAKRHVSATNNFFELVSDGNLSLIQAVEKFDYTRGNKFSTYASWAIIRNFARTIPDEHRRLERFRPSDSEFFDAAVDERSDVVLEEKHQMERESQVKQFLQELDMREKQILVSRFGLDRQREPRTLREVGVEVGVTKERIRQIEARALSKLRKVAEEEKLEIPGLE